MSLDVNEPPRPRHGRVIRRRLVQLQAEKRPHAQRIGRAPCDRTLGVQPFEVTEQQQAGVPPRRQPRTSPLIGVETLAEGLDISIEVRLGPGSDSVACRTGVRRFAGGPVWPSTSRACFAWRLRLPIAMFDSVVRGIDRLIPDSDFHHGLLGCSTSPGRLPTPLVHLGLEALEQVGMQ